MKTNMPEPLIIPELPNVKTIPMTNGCYKVTVWMAIDHNLGKVAINDEHGRIVHLPDRKNMYYIISEITVNDTHRVDCLLIAYKNLWRELEDYKRQLYDIYYDKFCIASGEERMHKALNK